MTCPDKPHPVYLSPGEWFSGQRQGLVETILGSCIAVTMFHQTTRYAAICHAVMPACSHKRECTFLCNSYSRYANCVIHQMAKWFFRQGIGAPGIKVKLFGGADGLSIDSGPGNSLRMGARNFEQARVSIEREGLSLETSDVGGSMGRKLLFDTCTGEVLMKRLHLKTDTSTRRFLVERLAAGFVNRGRIK